MICHDSLITPQPTSMWKINRNSLVSINEIGLKVVIHYFTVILFRVRWCHSIQHSKWRWRTLKDTIYLILSGHDTELSWCHMAIKTFQITSNRLLQQQLIPAFSHTKITSISLIHYIDVKVGTMASQITSLTIVYTTVYSSTDQRKHQSSASLAFVQGIHRSPVNSPHKGPVTQKMFQFDDVIMIVPLTKESIHISWSYEFSCCILSTENLKYSCLTL